ncbi:putative tyrosinase protein [Botrytis fragariae]|uniref:tyrosinase n=1 Tax=Botrytis fragariae TaxID=1964551 RepID=A0A8H6AHL4_9HELO|nr:putative tyrosinase protein [Botrytis fragariae]KAF5867520.1 putative tyrosinase protein [Botrytis fragariae]
MGPSLIRRLGALSLLLSSVIASPLSKPEHLKSRAGTLAITGVQDGGLQPRLEIRSLAADSTQWNLFLLAMIAYQGSDQNELSSFYQIAGIHGYPLKPWDGVQAVGAGTSGYCTHGSNLFGPWHRPYLALHEQQVHAWGVKIAQQFKGSNSEAYQQASLALRMPYWDWAANPANNGPILPNVLSNPTAFVTYPNGSTATVPNPLYSYSFHPLIPSDLQNSAPFNIWNNTLRWPTSNNANATSQNNLAEEQFEANLPNFRTQIMTLFANWQFINANNSLQPYNRFSNKGSGSSGLGNVESIHDTVHTLTGGFIYYGHMSIVPVAAFDPIFWFHHANIDRLIALWQAVYPDTYVEPTQQRAGTFTIQAGSTQDQNSPLTPFHRDTSGNFFSSADVRNVERLGYSYPEIINHPDNTTLQQNIAAIYASPRPASRNDKQPPQPHFHATTYVGVFLGKSSARPDEWAKDPAYVGMHATLGTQSMAPNDVIASSNVHLTDALIKKHDEGVLPDLNEDTIINYLTANLEWKAQKGGTEIDISTLAGAVVTTESIEVAAPDALGTFSNYKWVGDFKIYPGVFDALGI